MQPLVLEAENNEPECEVAAGQKKGKGMATVTTSRDQIFADKIEKVCAVARVMYDGSCFRSKWTFWSDHIFCRQKDRFTTLICERVCLAKTQRIAELLEREKITTKVNIVIAPDIWHVRSNQTKPRGISTRQHSQVCTHCGGTWKADRHGRCKRCGAPN